MNQFKKHGKAFHRLSKSEQQRRVTAYLQEVKNQPDEASSSEEEDFASANNQFENKENQPIMLQPFPLQMLNLPVELPIKTDFDIFQMEIWLKKGQNYWYLFEYLRVRVNHFKDLNVMFSQFISTQLLDDYTLASYTSPLALKERKSAKQITILYQIWMEVAEVQVKEMKATSALSKCYQLAKAKCYSQKRRAEQMAQNMVSTMMLQTVPHTANKTQLNTTDFMEENQNIVDQKTYTS